MTDDQTREDRPDEVEDLELKEEDAESVQGGGIRVKIAPEQKLTD